MAVFSKYFGASVAYFYAVWHGGLWSSASEEVLEFAPKTVLLLLGAQAGLTLFALASLFVARKGDKVIGKDEKSGAIPVWSYVVFWPFHSINWIAMYLKRYLFRRHISDATHVAEKVYIGGWFSDKVEDVNEWRAILDLTTEFPERGTSQEYLNIPTWDGNPPSIEDISRGAKFLAEHMKLGPTLCHCASGIGRSTTVLCAGLVVSGTASDYKEAFSMIQAKRSIVRLNWKMQDALERWQQVYTEKAKAE